MNTERLYVHYKPGLSDGTMLIREYDYRNHERNVLCWLVQHLNRRLIRWGWR